uniref:Peptidyl-prolyl cis-trans isomerase n=2 Tax=Coccolithus braarudii TaxID=221442 RepID=A0A7S0LSQ5_9EUKA
MPERRMLASAVLYACAYSRTAAPLRAVSQAVVASRPVVMNALDTTPATLSRRAAALVAVTAMSATTAHAEGNAYPRMVIETTQGNMEFELWDDVAPKHVKNILTLAKQGFFDGQAFHRIIPGFVIQGGDPNTKLGYGPGGTLEGGDKSKQRTWGRGGPGYNVPAEFNERLHEFGVLSMARSADPNSAGSQFFVCLGRLTSLDNKYTVFGKLTKGEEVLRKIGAAKTVAGDIPETRQGIQRIDQL